jgi:hypothetical protein
MAKQPSGIFVSLYFVVLGILLVVSAGMLVIGIREFLTEPTIQSIIYLLVGASGIGITLYSLRQVQSKSKTLKVQVAKVVTALDCSSCHNKATRVFKEGDYVYGAGEKCSNCNAEAPMTITSIYAEKPPQQQKQLI